MKFGVYDIWHGEKLRKWVYSDHSNFEGRLSLFFAWVEQHQRGYEGVIIAAENSGTGEHISQHSNGAEPQGEICPECKGEGMVLWSYSGEWDKCTRCNGSGKLRHC